MKKFISIITSGILAVIPIVPVQFSAYAVYAETDETSEKITIVDNAENFITSEITTATTQQAEM